MEARISTERHVQRQQKLKEQVDTRVAAAIEKKGILLVFTGNGQGKSNAAFGTVTRAVGHGKTVGVAQYIKGQWDNGEYNLLQPLGVEFPALQMVIGTGRGCHSQILKMADTVSEIRPVKHAFDNGIQAQPGIDW